MEKQSILYHYRSEITTPFLTDAFLISGAIFPEESENSTGITRTCSPIPLTYPSFLLTYEKHSPRTAPRFDGSPQ
jgi:hypothetical protein